MAYTEDQKVQIAKNALKHKIMQIETMTTFYAFAAAVTEEKILNLARADLVINRENAVSSGTSADTEIENIDLFDAELGT
jgi:hypothetical protein